MTAFRFGVVAAAQQGGARWRDTARRAEELGYSTLLSPDNLHIPTPTAALATAAAVTDRLRVGSFVLASPLRTARAAAWEAHSLTTLTEGRFELGLGTGLPSMREQAEELGLPYGSAGERLDAISATIDHVRRLDGEAHTHTPVMVAAGGPRARRLAAAKADIVTLAGGVLTPRDEFAAHVEELRSAADGRELELAMNIFVVGDEVPAWMRGFIQADAQALIENDSLTMLRGGVDDMAAELERRRAELGVSYVSVNSAFIEEFAPLVARLSGT
ncbi:LLM class flavin-dependent oxidoreductase [Actinomycetospora endophytica]|uniref:LLM class flavin-dependent oxidoreductase n=1 Tax=Actinomycetospora endophytica TaxID=2291215 RepID=A0ABS8PAC8_9PSEU|nr:LLM class flavin-dependent oxidoreductase [Actinomycetospora endophytica]MCD2195231.1 LLM class flavin-dependent oxidoreductase [Actinomycetospora endophytica]